jgi:hypothetical protein
MICHYTDLLYQLNKISDGHYVKINILTLGHQILIAVIKISRHGLLHCQDLAHS